MNWQKIAIILCFFPYLCFGYSKEINWQKIWHQTANHQSQQWQKNIQKIVTQQQQAIVPLLQHINNENPSIKQFAILAWQRLFAKHPQLVDSLKQTIEDEQADVTLRTQAVMGIGHLPESLSQQFVPTLLALLEHSHSDLKANALKSLSQIGASAVSPLIHAYLKASEQTKRQILWVLGEIPAKEELKLPVFTQALQSSQWQVRYAALSALSKTSPEKTSAAIPVVLSSLDDSSAAVQAKAMQTLTHYSHHAVAPLLENLQSASSNQRKMAILQVLPKLSSSDQVQDALVEIIKEDTDMRVRYVATASLAKMDHKAVPIFARLLASEKGRVRRFAAWGLGKIGPPAAPTAPVLVALLEDRFTPVQDSAAWALRQIGPGAIPALAQALENQSANTRFQALKVLLTMEKAQEQVLPLVVKALGDTNSLVVELATRTLLRDDPKTVKLLLGALNDSQPQKALRAAVILEKIAQHTSKQKLAKKINKKLSLFRKKFAPAQEKK